eukprot:3997942-Amphidinium_carterae.1
MLQAVAILQCSIVHSPRLSKRAVGYDVAQISGYPGGRRGLRVGKGSDSRFPKFTPGIQLRLRLRTERVPIFVHLLLLSLAGQPGIKAVVLRFHSRRYHSKETRSLKARARSGVQELAFQLRHLVVLRGRNNSFFVRRSFKQLLGAKKQFPSRGGGQPRAFAELPERVDILAH